MDNDLFKAIVVGVSSALTTLSIVPMLVKGKIRHERELVDRDTNHQREIETLKHGHDQRIQTLMDWHAEVIKKCNEERDRLLEQVEKQDDELQRQYEAITALGQQVFNQISYLQGLAGLAARDRRSDLVGQ